MYRYFFLFILVSLPYLVPAQKTSIYYNTRKAFNKGLALFDQEKYVAAQKEFEFILSETSTKMHPVETGDGIELIVMNAEYYRALCAVELFNNEAAHLFSQFIEHYYESPKVKLAYYHLGRYYFNTKKCRKAIPWFEKVDINTLNNEQQTHYKFQSGYCYFFVKSLDKAKALFGEIKDIKHKYYYPANYYYGYIALLQKDYNDALNSFLKIAPSKMYGKTIPYFICRAYFHKRDYDKLTEYASTVLENPKIKYRSEIHFLVGNGYFEKNQYKEAIPHFQKYMDMSTGDRNEDIYRLAYAQYKVGSYDDAIKNFNRISVQKDSLAQNVFYNMADCYIKTGKKHNARNAFKAASKMDFDQSIAEISAFNYSKLSFELGFHKLAINTIQEFITKYPESKSKTEAQELLTDIFLTTRDYQEAIKAIESFKEKSPKLLLAYQKVTYYKGVLLFRDKYYQNALNYFNRSLSNPIEIDLQMLTYYWRGEIYYVQHKFRKAIADFNKFKTLAKLSAKIPEGVSLAKANYTLGYCYLKQNDFKSSLGYLLDCISMLEKQKTNEIYILSDAYQRSADSYFMLKNYPKAIEYYDHMIQKKFRGMDYAYYQKGILHGLLKEYDNKMTALGMITKNFHHSIYIDDAIYEMGITSLATENLQEAIVYFTQITESYKNSRYFRKSLVNLGLIHYNLQENEKALIYYRQVVSSYPKSLEAREAIFGIKDLFISEGKADAYLSYLESVPEFKISASEADSVTYLAAESVFKQGDHKNSIRSFSHYLDQFEDGFFSMQAHFYRGECLYANKDYEAALNDYDYIINEPEDMFTEQALLKAARIRYFITKDYEKAHHHFLQLFKTASYKENQQEALIGIIRSAYHSHQYKDVNKYARHLLKTGQVGEASIIEAHFYLAKAAFENGKFDSAMVAFTKVVEESNNEMSAESKYHIGVMQFNRNNLDGSMATCFEIIKQVPSYSYWIIKSYILLADIYTQKGELFQAKATLQSIIDNYEGEELLKITEKKLFHILELEQKELEMKQDSLLRDSLQNPEVIHLEENDTDTIFYDNENPEINNDH